MSEVKLQMPLIIAGTNYLRKHIQTFSSVELCLLFSEMSGLSWVLSFTNILLK